jgi:hypothetical protein
LLEFWGVEFLAQVNLLQHMVSLEDFTLQVEVLDVNLALFSHCLSLLVQDDVLQGPVLRLHADLL